MSPLRAALIKVIVPSNGRLAVLASYTLDPHARDAAAAFAVVVLREDAMAADNLVVEHAVLLDYREAVSSVHGSYRTSF
jgi:FAD/FMN-containing dehydrogenase